MEGLQECLGGRRRHPHGGCIRRQRSRQRHLHALLQPSVMQLQHPPALRRGGAGLSQQAAGAAASGAEWVEVRQAGVRSHLPRPPQHAARCVVVRLATVGTLASLHSPPLQAHLTGDMNQVVEALRSFLS